MNLPLVKFHFIELVKLIKQEPTGPFINILAQICNDAEGLLNSDQFKGIKEMTPMVPIDVLQSERKRRQYVEKLFKKIQDNPAYPDEVKSDIAQSFQETMKEYRKQMKSLRQKRQQANSEAG